MRWAACLAAGAVCAAATLTPPANADWGGLERPAVQGVADRFVLRAAGMPRSFTTKLIEADAEHAVLDTEAKVASLTEADVWVIGLADWAQTEWLQGSPLYQLFAQRLHHTDADTPYRMFNWTLHDGRQIDLYFVHLGHVNVTGEACLASTIYALSRTGIAARRAMAAQTWDGGRAHPVHRTSAARGAFCD
ncbi:MAG: hypothetical protein AAF218_05315 [Pseudomonadota bacterium]